MRFDLLLSRADDETLQTILGGNVLRLLRLLDWSILTPSRLQSLLRDLLTPSELLMQPQYRALLFELLKPDEAERLATSIGVGGQNDIYAALRTVPIARGSTREQALHDFFEVALPLPQERSIVTSQAVITPHLPLFKHQRDVARKVLHTLAQEPRRVLLHMPTGSGKTRTAMQIIATHLRNHEPTLVIWLAYSEELCEQAATEFENAWQHIGDREVKVHRFWGAQGLSLEEARDGIVISSLTKLYRAGLSQLYTISTLAGRTSLVVIDEAHQAIATTYRLVLNTLVTQGRTAALLGLTATPGRTWNNVNADEELATFFASQKITLQVEGYPNPVDYLIEQGYLARAVFVPLLYHDGIELSANDLQLIETELDLPAAILQGLAADEQRNLKIIIKLEELARRHQRLIVFAASVDHSRMLAAILTARGWDAASISADTPSIERTRMIAEYKRTSPEPKILCNYGVLTTGFDAPQTSAALIARPTKSLVLYSQMVGRAIRGPRVGGNASAEIVTVIDQNLPGFGSVAEAFTNWEDVWREV